MNVERSAVRVAARLSPWLAPLPNAYMVGRAAVLHLGLPVAVAVLAGLVIELLGIATVHTTLTLYGWNQQPAVQRDKGAWQRAPVWIALATVGLYLGSVLLLTVMLDVAPGLARWAPAVFPLVTAVGAATLALISQHDARVERYCPGRPTSAQSRTDKGSYGRTNEGGRVRPTGAQVGAQARAVDGQAVGAQDARLALINAGRQVSRGEALDRLVALFEAEPELGATEAGRRLGLHRNTVYNYLDELVSQGRVVRDNGTVRVR